MIDIATYLRIFHPTPDDDFVIKRTAAIRAAGEVFFKKKRVSDFMFLANNLVLSISSTDNLDSFVIKTLEKALKDQSPSFNIEGQEQQILTCALISVLQQLDEHSTASTVRLSPAGRLAVSLWNGLFFQTASAEVKFENLRMDLMNRCKQIVDQESEIARSRKAIVEVKLPVMVADSTLQDSANAITKVVTPIIDALKWNSSLDREEIDILWWKMSNYCEVLKIDLSTAGSIKKAICNGIGISTLLRRLPANAHYHLITSSLNRDEVYDGDEILQSIADVSDKLIEYINTYSVVLSYPAIFPLFNAILSGRFATPAGAVKRPLTDWAGIALLESCMLEMPKFADDGR